MRIRLVTLLLLAPTLAWGSGQSNSGQGSQQSGASSNDLGDSSQQSGASSQTSGESFEILAHSSEQSQSDSAEHSTQGSASELVATASVIVVSGATVALGAWALVAVTVHKRRANDARMLRYLREHHALVARDVMESDGPLLEGWYVALGLTADERLRAKQALDATDEQASMLAALDSLDSVEQARRFAGAFVSALTRALGETRVRVLVEIAAQRLT